MATQQKIYQAATAHNDIEELFEDVFMVRGSVQFAPGILINRNMFILRQGQDLTIISSIRLSPEGEANLNALGEVKHVIRLGDFHGRDDPYYMDHYSAEFWRQPGAQTYPEPQATKVLEENAKLPIDDAELFVFRETKLPECAILLKRHGGILFTSDSLQYHQDYSNCSWLAKIIMRLAGFKLTTIVGPPWKKRMTKKGGSLRPDFDRLLDLEFDHHVGAHGRFCRDNALQLVHAAVERAYPTK